MNRTIVLCGVLIPFAGLLAAIALLLWQGGDSFSWIYPLLLLGMYLITVTGITVGYHRYFTHRAFQAPRPVVFLMAVAGAMAAQGPVLKWVAVHRRHHHHSDEEGAPHSLHIGHGRVLLHTGVRSSLGFWKRSGQATWSTILGLWHAHMGWILGPDEPDLARYVVDLNRDPLVRTVSSLFPLWVLLGLLIPAALGGFLTGTLMGALWGFVWGGLVRIFLVHHVTWSINSVCHIWGSRPFECADESRNNPIFGVLALGEGWHNNHHAFPSSARHGLRWWQFDAGWLVIRAMALFGLARNVRVPAPARIAVRQCGPA